MGVRTYLIDGVSGTGKTTVCDELISRGYHAVQGDRVLAYQGDPVTGAPLPGSTHAHHIWDVAKVGALAADRSHRVTFLCGGSRNFRQFRHLLDGVFVLEVDRATLLARLDARPADEFGGRGAERDLVLRLHATGGDVAPAPASTRPVDRVVDAILAACMAGTVEAPPASR